MATELASLCQTCAAWRVYPCIIGALKTEAWRCFKAVQGAPARTDCTLYQREPGSDDE